MPAVRMLGRRWSFATDDCPILLFVPVLLQGAWAIALLVCWIVIDSHKEECYKEAAYQIVLTALFSTFTVFFFLGCWTIYEGLKGSTLSCNYIPLCPGLVEMCSISSVMTVEPIIQYLSVQ